MSYVIASNATGPLPLNITFNPPLDGPATIGFSGSAWTQADGCVIGVDVLLDGALLGSALLFSNQSATHRALPTQFFATTLGDSQQTITLRATNGNTITDPNDFFSVWIM